MVLVDPQVGFDSARRGDEASGSAGRPGHYAVLARIADSIISRSRSMMGGKAQVFRSLPLRLQPVGVEGEVSSS